MKRLLLFLIPLINIVTSCKTKSKKEAEEENKVENKPNILIVLSDDQSYPHAGIYGCEYVNTPVFDRVANEGLLFTQAYAPSPSSSPTRASLLTGKNIWELEEAGVLCSTFPRDLNTLPEILEQNGYHTGFTGKGWEPGDWYSAGWDHNPAGNEYNEVRLSEDPPTTEIMFNKDYAANFEKFLSDREDGQPFYFWYGSYEPHRPFEYGSGYRAGKKLSDVTVPPFLYDDSITRMDLLDYAYEIEWFDEHLGRMIRLLEDMDELDNTIIIVTSDNGMPFPRAKVSMYEYSLHMPLAIRWGNKIKKPRVVNDLIGLIDIMPTILESSNISIPADVKGKSFYNLFEGPGDKPHREYVLAGKERHNYAREDNMCYPIRVIRTDTFLYKRNFKPERWPVGAPPVYKDSELSKVSGQTILNNKDKAPKAKELFELIVNKKPAEELYNIIEDPGCLNNLAELPEYKNIKQKHWTTLKAELESQNDPRIFGEGDVFDSYPVVWPIVMKNKDGSSKYPGFAEQGKYNPKFMKK